MWLSRDYSERDYCDISLTKSTCTASSYLDVIDPRFLSPDVNNNNNNNNSNNPWQGSWNKFGIECNLIIYLENIYHIPWRLWQGTPPAYETELGRVGIGWDTSQAILPPVISHVSAYISRMKISHALFNDLHHVHMCFSLLLIFLFLFFFIIIHVGNNFESPPTTMTRAACRRIRNIMCPPPPPSSPSASLPGDKVEHALIEA